MKYIFLILFIISGLFSSSKFTEEMKYETNYEIALNKAKNENKNLMMLVTSESCPWCRKLERQTLRKEDINDIIQKSYIPLNVDQDLKNYPKNFEVKYVPTVYFIDSKSGKIIQKSVGYKNKKEFSNILGKIK